MTPPPLLFVFLFVSPPPFFFFPLLKQYIVGDPVENTMPSILVFATTSQDSVTFVICSNFFSSLKYTTHFKLHECVQAAQLLSGIGSAPAASLPHPLSSLSHRGLILCLIHAVAWHHLTLLAEVGFSIHFNQCMFSVLVS